MVLFHSQRHIILPEFQQPVRLFPAVTIDLQVDTRSQGINITGNTARWVKRLGIGQVIHQFYEISGHFISPQGLFLLNFFPPVFIFFYEQSFAQ